MAVQTLTPIAFVLLALHSVWSSVIATAAEQASACHAEWEEGEDLVAHLQIASSLRQPTQASALIQEAQAPAAAAKGKSEIAYIGSRDCDNADKVCVSGPSGPEDVIFALEVFADGTLVPRPELATNVGDLPAWLTVAKLPSQTCLFASLDSNRILGLAIESDGRLNVSTAGANPGGRSMQSVAMSNGEFLLSANYNSLPSVASLQIGAGCDVRLADSVEHVEDPDVQWSQPHVHGVVSMGSLLYVCDWGTDLVSVYSVSPSTGIISNVSNVSTPPGCGPRHAVQHPSASLLYVICQVSAEVLTFSQADEGRSLELVQASAISPGGCPGCQAAELAILPDGSVLYASNRGAGAQNTVTAYAIGAEDGHLQFLQQVEAPSFPCAMTLAMGGRLLLVAGQTHTELVSFSVEPDGQLKSTGHRVTQGLPPHPAAIAIF